MANWKWLLVFRFAAWNLFGAGLLAFAWQRGLIDHFVIGDPSRLSFLVCAIFLVGLFQAARASLKLSAMLNDIKSNPWSRGAGAYEVADLESGQIMTNVSYYSGALVTIGLLGTVFGISVAVMALVSAQAGDLGQTIGEMAAGSGAALYPTIVAIVGSLWLLQLEHMLGHARTKLLVALRRAGA